MMLFPVATDAQASIAVSSIALVTAALPLVAALGQAVARRWGQSSAIRPVTLTTVRWHDPRRRRSPEELARTFRRGALWFGAINLGLIAAQLAPWPGSRSSSLVFKLIVVSLSAWATLLAAVIAVNMDVRRACHDAFARGHRALDIAVAGDPVDVLAEMQRFARRHHFDLYYTDYRPEEGLVTMAAIRVWAGIFIVPQYLAMVGSVLDRHVHLTVLADVRPPSRYDFGTCEANLRRLLAHFAASDR